MWYEFTINTVYETLQLDTMEEAAAAIVKTAKCHSL